MTPLPAALIVRVAVYLAETSEEVPTATIRACLIATAPSSMTRDEASIVTTVPPRMIKSTRSAAVMLEGRIATSRATIRDEWTTILLKRESSGSLFQEERYRTPSRKRT